MILLIDKPEGITSQGVVSKIKYALKKYDKNIKVGHSGTLDPICTGLLPVLVGKDTKLLPFLPSKKAYTARILLGRETDTEDITGKTLAEKEVNVTFDELSAVAKTFVGKITQIPPMYSAIKVNGQKLYDLARKGVEIEREGREVEIFSLSVLPTETPNQYILNVACSSGTYIRTLCADIGKKLGCGACMASLRRTISNGFSLENATPLSEAISLIENENVSRIALSSEEIFQTERAILPKNGENYYLNGGSLSLDRISAQGALNGIVRVYNSKWEYCGIGLAENNFLKPLLNY